MLRIKEGFTGQLQIRLPKMIVDQQKKDPLLSNLYITDMGFYPHAEGHYRTRPHAIEEHVLIYCVRGKGCYTLGEHTFDVSANQYFILPAKIPHTYWADEQDPWTIYWIHFSGALAPYYMDDVYAGPHDVKPSLSSRIAERNHIFEEIFLSLKDNQSIENLRYASSLLYYYLASMHFLSQYRHDTHPMPAEGLPIIPAILHYMQENLGTRLSLESVSNYTGYSISHLSKIFHEQTGLSPLAYFNRLKIEEAQRLLTSTKLSITQISNQLGIDDPYYFSRLFHKHTGYTPTAWRATSKKSDCPEHCPQS